MSNQIEVSDSWIWVRCLPHWIITGYRIGVHVYLGIPSRFRGLVCILSHCFTPQNGTGSSSFWLVSNSVWLLKPMRDEAGK
jgi:hypothetical protein